MHLNTPKFSRFSRDSLEFAYFDEGDPAGPPVMLIHGFASSAIVNWVHPGWLKTLSDAGRRVIAIDNRGHGASSKPHDPAAYHPSLMAGDAAALLDHLGIEKADVFGYSMGAAAGLQLVIRHPEKVNRLVAASVSYDAEGWQPEFKAFIPQMTVEMFVNMPFAQDYRKLAANPDGFPELVRKLIALEHEPMAWEADVKKLKTPVLIITGDADVTTLEHSVKLFRLLGGGGMGDMGKPLPASRLAVLPATSHTAVIGQTDLLIGMIEPFLKGEVPKGMFQ